mgnify:CR=1 FL=1
MSEPGQEESADVTDQTAPDPATAGQEEGRQRQDQRLPADAGALGSRISDLVRDATTLLQAESRLFVLALLWMLVLLVCAGLLLATALIALLLAALAALVQSGWLSWTLAPLLAALALLLVVAVLLWLVRLIGRDLGFRRSRALLRPAPDKDAHR